MSPVSGADGPSRLLILFAHPALQRSRANRRLVEAARDLDRVTVRDLYEIYPDFDIDVPLEQELVRQHDILVFQHPFYWYSAPALLREWQDLVLEYGFAYGHGGTALRGKGLLSVVTTGADRQAYDPSGRNHFTMRQLLAPFEQLARFCGMRYLPPFVVHGMLQARVEERMERTCQELRHVLCGLRDGAFAPRQLEAAEYLQDLLTDDGRAPEGDHGR